MVDKDHSKSSHMFSSNFPEGLRVLVFDDDPQYLLMLENQLQELQYEVTRCMEEERAFNLLRNHRNRFDIAIIDAKISDDRNFQLVSEIDFPIIIISEDDSVQSVTNWMSNGASDYLIKPLRREELRFIYKHVAKRKQWRRNDVAAVDGEVSEKSSSLGDSTIRNFNKKRRSSLLEGQGNNEEDNHCDRISPTKKRRVVWDEKLHKKFIEAVEVLGIDTAVPKKILEKMNVAGITRENVASHLQKYRMNMKKRNDQNEREERNRSLNIARQAGRMFVGEEAADFYGGVNNHFPTHHISDIHHQPFSVQQQNTNRNLSTQLVTPLEYHHNGLPFAVSGNEMMPHQFPTSELAYIENAEERLVYNNIFEDDASVANLTYWYMENSEEETACPFLDTVMETTTSTRMIPEAHHFSTSSLDINPPQMMNVNGTHEPSILQFDRSFPPSSTSYRHSPFIDQKKINTMMDVNGRFKDNNGYRQ